MLPDTLCKLRHASIVQLEVLGRSWVDEAARSEHRAHEPGSRMIAAEQIVADFVGNRSPEHEAQRVLNAADESAFSCLQPIANDSLRSGNRGHDQKLGAVKFRKAVAIRLRCESWVILDDHET